jgi:hypothetical protein
MMDIKDLTNRFTFHPVVHVEGRAPEDQQARKHTAIRTRALDYAVFLDGRCPDSRELSLAITKLQEVVFWANAAIACNGLEGDE